VSNLAGLRPEAVNSDAVGWGLHDIIVRATSAPNPKSEAFNAIIVFDRFKLNSFSYYFKIGCKVTIFICSTQDNGNLFCSRRLLLTIFLPYVVDLWCEMINFAVHKHIL
jgi:hypothetical protein